MIIDKIHIKGFGKLQDKKLEFKNGINIVFGKNEAGKTTIHRFIEAMLFGFHREQAKIRKYNSEYDIYKPEGISEYGGEMILKKGRKSYKIDRRFSNRETMVFYDHDQKIDLTQSLPFDNVYKVSDLSSWLGISYRNFLNTVYLTQIDSFMDRTYYTQIEKELIRGNDRKMSSAIFNKAINWINDERSKIGSESRKKTSEYGKTISKLEELEKEKNQILELEKELAELIKNVQNYRLQKSNLISQLDKQLEFKEKMDLKKKYERYSEFQIKKNDFESLKKELEYYAPYKNYSEREYADLKELEFKIDGLKNQLSEIKKNEKVCLNELKDIEKSFKSKKIVSALSFLAAILSIGGLLFIKGFSNISLLFGLVVIAFAIVLSYINIFKISQKKKYKLDGLKNIQIRADDIEIIKQKLNRKLRDFRDEVACINANDYRAGLEKKQTYYQLFNKKCEDEVLISRLKDEFVGFNYDRNKALELDLLDDEMEIQDINILKKAIEEVQRELDYTEGLLNGSYDGKRSLVDIQTDIDYYEKRKEFLEFEIEAHKNAASLLEKLRESENQLETDDYQKLYDESIYKITNGKYSTLIIKENGDIELKEDITGKNWSMDNLSAGTKEQIFLAIRLSLRKIMKYKERYPMIVDEAFVKYDDDRLRYTFEALNGDEDDQIIVFTCSNREKNLLDDMGLEYNLVKI